LLAKPLVEALRSSTGDTPPGAPLINPSTDQR
jgi:hypothetical protein